MAERGWFKNSEFSPDQWMELLNNYLRVYYEDQDSDDMDRVYRSQEAQALTRLFNDYANGEATVDDLVAFEIDFLSDIDGVTEWWDQTVSIAEADRIIETLETNPAELTNIPAPTGTKTSEYVENGALTFAGSTPTTPIATVGNNQVVLRGGAGVTVDIKQVIDAGGRVFGEGGILNAVVPYIPGISLPSWMPTAGVIFLPSVGEAIDKISTIITNTDISGAIEEGDFGEILNDIGTIIVGAGGELVSEVEGQINKILGQIQGAVADPTQAGTIIGGVLAGSFPSGIPDWLGGILAENIGGAVYGAARNVLVNAGAATEEQLPLTQETPEQDPALMFTHRGDNYFVNSEENEYFQLEEDAELEFDVDGLYSRADLEETGLETLESGTYQSLLDDYSFYALTEDIYQYPIKELVKRFEEEGGIIPGDFELMDDESQYDFFINEFFDPTPIRQAPIPTDDPDPDPDPDPNEDDDEDTTTTGDDADETVGFTEEEQSLIRGLFADIIGDASLATTADIATGVTQVLIDSGIIDAEGNVIRPDLQGSIITALTSVGILNEDGQFIQQAIPNIQTEVLAALTTAGILDEEGNVIRQEAVDVEGGVLSALQTLGIVNADGQVSLDVSDSVLLTLQNAGIVDADGNVIEQDVSGQFLTTLQGIGLVDAEGNLIQQEAPDIEGGVISALQTIGLVDADGQLALDVSGDVLSLLQNAGIVDAEGNVIEQDLTDQFVTTLQEAGVIDEEGASLLATSEDLSSLRDELIASGVIGEDVTVASQADLDNLVTALTESGLLGEDAIFATTGDISGLRDDLVAAGLIGEGADVATATDLANLRAELAAAGLIGEDAIDFDETLRTALSEFGFTQDQLDQIAGAIDIPAGLSGEDVAQLFTDADLSTATNVTDAVTAITDAIDALDVDTTVRTALSEFEFTDDQLDQISGAIDIPDNLSGEQITQLFTDADLATATNVTDAVNAINLSLSNLGFATPDNVRDILSDYAFSEAQINQIVNAMPAGLQLTDIGTLVDTALTGVATSEGLETATTTITDAISGLNFATDAGVRTALTEFNFTESQLNQISALMPDTLTQNELTLALNASLENVPTNASMDEAFLSITNSLATGFDAITGEDGVLERQTVMLDAITGLGEGQQDLLRGQEDILTGVGEESQRLEDIIMSSTGLLAAIGAGGLGGGAPARPRAQPYKGYLEKLEYAPGMVEALKPQQQVDYNKEVDRLLTMGMGGKKPGMLV